LYQSGAPAALPGKTFSYMIRFTEKILGHRRRTMFSGCWNLEANNSTDTNKIIHPFRNKELMDDKYDYDYNINSRIKIQARKEGQNKENVGSQVVAMIANCPPMYTDVYERQQK